MLYIGAEILIDQWQKLSGPQLAYKKYFEVLRLSYRLYQINMLYFTGEAPMVGDWIVDRRHKLGTVTRVMSLGGTSTELVIAWEDHTIGIRYSSVDALALVGSPSRSNRKPKRDAVLNIARRVD